MDHKIVFTAIVAASLSTMPIALAQTTTSQDVSGLQPGAAGATARSAQDNKFIKLAAMSGLAEVETGRLAETKGDAAVKSVGRLMVVDHTKANAQLKSVAAAQGAAIPDRVSTTSEAMTRKLEGLQGKAFDKRYLANQKATHEVSIRLYKTEAAQGKNPALKALARSSLPMLEMHLKAVEAAIRHG